MWPAPVCSGSGGSEGSYGGGGAGPENPRLRPRVGVGVTFASPTQKSETMTPEPVTRSG